MYEPFRASLMAIWGEMSRASRKYPALYHQRLSDPLLVGPDVISVEAFLAFQKAYPQRSTDEWVSWQRTPDGSCWGRFHGSVAGLDEFERLAESAYLVLQKFDSELPEGHGFHGWLNVIHDMARDFPTPLLRTRNGVWGVDRQPVGERFDELVTNWKTTDESGIRYRPHPFFNLLVHNVFTSSMSAIELILNPEKALLVGEWLDDIPMMASSFGGLPSSKPEHDDSPQQTALSDVQDQLNEGSETVNEGKIARPIIEMAFDGATWHFQYDFAGIKESGPITTDIKGFIFYQAILKHDGEERWTSLEFEKESGSARPKEFLSSTGTVDANAANRKAVFDAEDDGEPVVLESASTDRMIDDEDRFQLFKDISSLQEELETCQNPERTEFIDQELERLMARHSRSVNIRGQSRTVNCSEEEKARKRVTNSLSTARNTLMKSMPTLAYYLKKTVTNDNGWSYNSRLASALIAKRM